MKFVYRVFFGDENDRREIGRLISNRGIDEIIEEIKIQYLINPEDCYTVDGDRGEDFDFTYFLCSREIDEEYRDDILNEIEDVDNWEDLKEREPEYCYEDFYLEFVRTEDNDDSFETIFGTNEVVSIEV